MKLRNKFVTHVAIGLMLILTLVLFACSGNNDSKWTFDLGDLNALHSAIAQGNFTIVETSNYNRFVETKMVADGKVFVETEWLGEITHKRLFSCEHIYNFCFEHEAWLRTVDSNYQAGYSVFDTEIEVVLQSLEWHMSSTEEQGIYVQVEHDVTLNRRLTTISGAQTGFVVMQYNNGAIEITGAINGEGHQMVIKHIGATVVDMPEKYYIFRDYYIANYVFEVGYITHIHAISWSIGSDFSNYVYRVYLKHGDEENFIFISNSHLIGAVIFTMGLQLPQGTSLMMVARDGDNSVIIQDGYFIRKTIIKAFAELYVAGSVATIK